MKEFAIEYPWADGNYVLLVKADSADEAMSRVRQAANLGKCFTPFGCEPMISRWRWMANLELALTKMFRRGAP